MTAINLFVQPSAAYLLTDGAYYDSSGTIIHLASKVAVASGLSLAFACSGTVQPDQLCQLFSREGCVTQEEFLRLLPGVMRELREANRRENPVGEAEGLNDFQVFAAFYSLARQRAEARICSTNQAYFGPVYRPYSLADVTRVSSPPVELPFVDPERDGLAIIEAQRAGGTWEDRRCYVGGFAELTTVLPDRIEKKILRHWPDKVGQTVSAAASAAAT